MLLLVPDKELTKKVFNSISMAVLSVVDKVSPLGSNFLKLMGKNRSCKRNYLLKFFSTLLQEIFSRKNEKGIKRQAAPNCQIASIVAPASWYMSLLFAKGERRVRVGGGELDDTFFFLFLQRMAKILLCIVGLF